MNFGKTVFVIALPLSIVLWWLIVVGTAWASYYLQGILKEVFK